MSVSVRQQSVSVSVRQSLDRDQKMAPRFPRPVTVLPAGSRLQRPEEGARCYKKKCTKKSSNSRRGRRMNYECVEAMRRQLRCCTVSYPSR